MAGQGQQGEEQAWHGRTGSQGKWQGKEQDGHGILIGTVSGKYRYGRDRENKRGRTGLTCQDRENGKQKNKMDKFLGMTYLEGQCQESTDMVEQDKKRGRTGLAWKGRHTTAKKTKMDMT
jgi:hypothetical protein